MKITAEKDQESQYIVRIEVDADELNSAKDRAVKRLGNRIRVPGFRPGKAPRVIVERMIGQEALIEEATKDILPKAYKEALENKDIKPIADPQVNIESLNPLTIIATIPVEPTVTLGDYRSLRFEQTAPEIGDEEVEKSIQQMREQKTTWTALEEERPAQLGDKVEITLQTIRDGEEIGEPVPRNGELGKGEMLEQIDDQIAGMSVSEEKVIEITRKPTKPASDEDANEEKAEEAQPDANEANTIEAPKLEENAGELDEAQPAATEVATPEIETIPLSAEEEEQQGLRPLTFKAVLKSIQVKNEPELNDEFAVSVGAYTSMDELRETTLKNLKTQAENNAKREVTDNMVKAIVEQTHFEIPHVMVHAEADALEQNLEATLKQQKLNLKLYLQYTGKSHEEMHQELHVQAEERIRTALALREIAVREGVSVAGEELDRAVEKTVNQYTATLPEDSRAESATQLRQIFGGEESRRRLEDDLFSRKLAQRLLEIAGGNAPEPSTPVELEDENQEEVAAISAPENVLDEDEGLQIDEDEAPQMLAATDITTDSGLAEAPAAGDDSETDTAVTDDASETAPATSENKEK